MLLAIMASLVGLPGASAASSVGPQWGNTDAMWINWDRTDAVVKDGTVSRTWMWGPEDQSLGDLREVYQDAPGGWRTVRYFDKSRMEITHPGDDAMSQWYVTNGLLAEELITGRVQLGDNQFDQQQPANVNVAGDANDPNGPTYATFNPLMSYGATPSGWIITNTVTRDGKVAADPSLSSYAVTAKDVGAPTQHTVASVFWQFMNSSGPIEQLKSYDASKHVGTYVVTDGPLFSNPFYATGYPLTEPYWTHVLVGGVSKVVLVQVFERRVLTYTPSNPDGWKVEAGNVGQHYYSWRYGLKDMQYSFDQSVTPATQTVMKECVAAATSQFGTAGPALLSAPGSVDGSLQVASTYFGGTVPDSIRQEIPNLAGIAFGNQAIVIDYIDDADACHVAAHEYAHLVQQVQARFDFLDTPDWFIEGGAEFVGTEAEVAHGYTTLDATRAAEMNAAKHYNMSLANSSKDSIGKYVLGFLAADWLVTHSGAGAVSAYWTSLPSTGSWQKSFQQAFGMSVDDFYAQFAQYQAQNFPAK